MIITDVENNIKSRPNYVVDSYNQVKDGNIYTLTYKVDSNKINLETNESVIVRKTYREKWEEDADGNVSIYESYKLIEEVVL